MGRGADPPRGHQLTILSKFPKKLHEIEKILGQGGGVITGFLSLSMIVLKGVLQQKLKALLVVKCWLYLV